MPTNYWLKFGNTPLGYNGSGVQYTHVEQPGSITVTNSVTVGGSGFDPTKLFGVTITFGEPISYVVDGVPVLTPSSTCSLYLADGQSSVVSNIPYNTTYTISEVPMTPAEISAGYTNGTVTGSSGIMSDSGDIRSTATYIYEEPNTAVINGKRYRTTTIDGKVWLAENYTYAVGSANPGGMPTTAAYWDYADSVLYNRYAVRQIIDNPPLGWHIPTQAEWEALETYVGDVASKIKSTSGWRTDTGYGNGTDDYGFDGKPLGMRYSGSNSGVSSEACWWTSTEVTSTKFAEVDLIYYSDAIRILTTQADGTGAYSIRLIKDY